MRSIFSVTIACLLLLWLPIIARSHPASSADSPPKPKDDQRQPQRSDADTLDFSGTGRPGQQTAGESRGGCSNLEKPIRAMLPTSNSGKTVLSHPRFWVHFPESQLKDAEVEFVVQNSQREDIWRSRDRLYADSNYQSFGIPTAQTALEVGQWYRWYVKLYCGNHKASSQYIQGWVNRVPLNSLLQLELQRNRPPHLTYAHHRIWYEAINELLTSYHLNPHLALEEDWQNIISAKGVDLHKLPSLGGSKLSHH